MRVASLKSGLVVAVMSAMLLWPAAKGIAQNPKESTSLKFAPARAVFYSTGLRQKEMLERMTASKAFKRMVEHKVLSTAIARGTMQYEQALEGFKQGNPEAWA